MPAGVRSSLQYTRVNTDTRSSLQHTGHTGRGTHRHSLEKPHTVHTGVNTDTPIREEERQAQLRSVRAPRLTKHVTRTGCQDGALHARSRAGVHTAAADSHDRAYASVNSASVHHIANSNSMHPHKHSRQESRGNADCKKAVAPAARNSGMESSRRLHQAPVKEDLGR